MCGQVDSAAAGPGDSCPVPADIEYGTSRAWVRFRVHDSDGNSTAARPGIANCGRRQEGKEGTGDACYCTVDTCIAV